MASNILDKLKWRYATKKFDSSRVLSKEKLMILKESFNLTATSYGLQPLKMILIGDNELKEKLVPITMAQNQVRDASHVLVLCIEDGIDKEYIESHFSKVEKVRDTSRNILEPFEQFLINEFSNKDTEVVNEWMAKQAYIALGNLLTVCALEEIDACPIEGFEPDAYDEILDLRSKKLRSVLVLAVGYRHELDMFSELKKVRRGVEEVVIEI